MTHPSETHPVIKENARDTMELCREQSGSVTDHRHNFLLLVAYQVVVRTGWIFKTESIVMPAVLDLTGAGAWMRAILPTLNRFGQTIPPPALFRRPFETAL